MSDPVDSWASKQLLVHPLHLGDAIGGSGRRRQGWSDPGSTSEKRFLRAGSGNWLAVSAGISTYSILKIFSNANETSPRDARCALPSSPSSPRRGIFRALLQFCRTLVFSERGFEVRV